MKKWLLYIGTMALFLYILLPVFLFKPSYHFSIPVQFSKSGQPIIPIEIENKNYLVILDSGYSDTLTLQNASLQNLSKTPCGQIEFFDGRGNEYQSPLFKIPQLRLQKFVFKNIKVEEENLQFGKNSSITGSDQRTDEEMINEKPGRVGRKLLQSLNLFMDFSHSTMIASSDIQSLKKENYRIENMISVPFDLCHREGIVIKVETDLGPKSFMLDSGTTQTLLRSTPDLKGKIFLVLFSL